MRATARHLSAWILASLAAAAPLRAGRLAGTVHVRAGAVSALSGRGENQQIRRSNGALRVDLGETLRTSPYLEAVFIGHDETSVPLDGSAVYEVARDGIWRRYGERRLRVHEFLRPPGQRARPRDPRPDAPLANLRATGAARVRGGREFRGRLFEEDEALGANSVIHLGLQDQALLALVGDGRVALHPGTSLRLQRKALVLEEGRVHLRAGGPAALVLTDSAAVAAEPGALLEVEAPAPGEVRVLAVSGRVVVAPPPRAGGPRRTLEPGEQLVRDAQGAVVVVPSLSGPALASARQALGKALAGADPEEVVQRARASTEEPEVQVAEGTGSQQFRLGAASPAAAEDDPALPPRFVPEPTPRVAPGPREDDRAAMAVARTLEATPGKIGSAWSSRDGRRPSRREPTPGVLPPGLLSTSGVGLDDAEHPLWSSAHAVKTPPGL